MVRKYFLAFCGTVKDRKQPKKPKGTSERKCEFEEGSFAVADESLRCNHMVWLSPDNVKSLERGKQKVACSCHTEAVNQMLYK